MTNQNIVPGVHGRVFEVQPHKMLRELAVQHLVDLIKHEIQQVEPRDESRGKVNITRNGEFCVVFRAYGVSCSENGCSGVEGGDDTGFRYGDGLLFLLRGRMSAA